MSFFRRAWVLPGGHVDPGEHLEDAALRELEEECGINIREYGEKDCQILCAFESSTPGKSSSLPASSHLIIFYRVKLHVKASAIKMKYDRKEVGAGVWLSQSQLKQVLSREDTSEMIDSDEYIDHTWSKS